MTQLGKIFGEKISFKPFYKMLFIKKYLLHINVALISDGRKI